MPSAATHDYLGESRLVDACVKRLRAKIETHTSEPLYIQTARGFGYRFGPVHPESRRDAWCGPA